MSRKKGVSAEEKRSRMLDIFYEKKEVFQLKELEKIAPKEKGIVAQSVKDVVQSLVDDGLVDTDKIGTSVYFWAFPSKAANNRKRRLSELQNKVDESGKKLKKLEEQVTEAKSGREDSEERNNMLKELLDNKKTLAELKSKIEEYKDCDPEVLEEMKKQITEYKDAANMWTDNIFSIKSWCQKKFFIEEAILNKQFEIPEDLDYVD